MRLMPRLSALGLACLGAASAQAMDLGQAWEAALRHDGQYRVAGLELAATRQVVPIARASLLPSVVLQASTSAVNGTREFPNSLNQEVRVPVDYKAPQAGLQLRTPLFNAEAYMRWRQAGAQVEGAEALYESRGLDLAERVGTTYLQALLAHENVGLAEAEIRAIEAQLEKARQRQARGEGTRTEVAQGQAALDLARVKLIEALDQVDFARRNLRRLTGEEPMQLKRLPPDFMPTQPQPAQMQDWVELAERQNPILRARRQSLEVARLGVHRTRAGHLPRVDLVAGLSHSRNESISSLNQTSTLKSVGVQLNLPLYSGGGVEASVKQSLAERERAEEEINNEREALQIELQRHFRAASNGGTRVDAYRRLVASGETALEGASRALEAGLATQADVLEAQARRYSAERDLAQARYEYLNSRMRLMLLAGMPVAEVVNDLDRVLTVDLQLKTRAQP